MNGYYTVQLKGSSLTTRQRIEHEARFAAEFERALGGGERARQLCLQAARGDAHAAGIIRRVRDQLEPSLSPPGCSFSLQAWEAIPL